MSSFEVKPLTAGKQKKTIPVLDGVRAVACLAIISFHMNLLARFNGIWTPDLDGFGAFVSATLLFGESGVILFFVLSGFLLFLPYATAMLTNSEWPSLRRFFIRRIFRIWPGYYVALFIMVLLLAPDYLKPEKLSDLWLFITFRMDFPATFQLINSPFWTLAIEFQYYILLPFLAYGLKFLVGQGNMHARFVKLTLCLIAFLAWGFGIRYWGIFASTVPPMSENWLAMTIKPYIYGTAGKFYEVFAIGMLISTLYIYLQRLPEKVTLSLIGASSKIFVVGLFVLGFVTLWHFYMLFVGKTLSFFDPYQDFLIAYRDLLQPIIYALAYGLCLFSLLHAPTWLKRPFELKPLRLIGLLSYSLYMWHYPLILLFQGIFLPRYRQLGWDPAMQGFVYWFWLLITAFPISFALYRYVELPGIRLGEKLCQLLAQKSQNNDNLPPPNETETFASPNPNADALKIREEVFVTSGLQPSNPPTPYKDNFLL